VVLLPEHDAELRFLTLWGAPLHNPTAMVRRSVFDEMGLLYRPDYDGAEDYDLWARVVQQGPIANLPSVECLYRTWEESNTARHSHRVIESHLRIADAYASALLGADSELLEDAAWLVRLLLRRPALDEGATARLGTVLVRLVDAYLARRGSTGTLGRLALLRCAGEQALYTALKGASPRDAAAAVRALVSASPWLFAGGVWAQLRRQGCYEWPRLIPGVS
jgi:hypothetical protein